MADVRANQLPAALAEGDFILRRKFLREKDDNWVLDDKFEPVRVERNKGQGVIEISRDTKPWVLTGIDSVVFRTPILSLRLPTASTQSEIQIPPIWLH